MIMNTWPEVVIHLCKKPEPDVAIITGSDSNEEKSHFKLKMSTG